MGRRIVVYGAGAIGSQIGARLHGAGEDVTLVEPWEPQRSAIARRGVTIRNPSQGAADEHHAPPVIAPSELSSLDEPIDLLFLCVKSYDTDEAVRTALPYLAPDGLVVSMQNSINEEWVAPIVGNDRMLGGVILINAVLLEPGHVTATTSVSRASANKADMPGVYVGEYLSSAGEKARGVASVLSAVWPAVAIDDLLHERWSKLANNVMLNTVSGVTGMRSAEGLANADARSIYVALAAEVLRVAEAEGHPLEVIMGDYAAADVHAGAEGRSDVVERGLARRAKLVSADATTSMLQDVLRGRQTEVDYFSGLIGLKGRAHGIPTPFCDAVTELAHRVEAGTLVPSPAVLTELRSIVGASL